MRENLDFITNGSIIDENVHSAFVYEEKVESLIYQHVAEYPDQPMFMFYSMQLVHSPWEIPDIYINRCEYPSAIEEYSSSTMAFRNQNYCGMVLMMDEAITNLTCAIEASGIANNTILIISGDNGGADKLYGNYFLNTHDKCINMTLVIGGSYPFRGNKMSLYRGGVSTTAIIHSPLLPDDAIGTRYYGQVHITG